MKIECECGTKLPCITAGQALTCACGVTYTATVSAEVMLRKQRALAEDVKQLAETVVHLSVLVRGR